jgi:hypothetical protein
VLLEDWLNQVSAAWSERYNPNPAVFCALCSGDQTSAMEAVHGDAD